MPETSRLTFTLRRLRARAIAWLVIGLVAFAMLAPTVTQALVPTSDHGMEVCTSSGPRTVSLDTTGDRVAADALARAPAPGIGSPADAPQPGALAGMHCPLCMLSHGGLAPPPAQARFALALALVPSMPWAPQAAPVCGAHQWAAAPRGPPPLA